MAFECENCNFRNSEVQMGGFIPEKGVRFELTVAKGDMKARPPAAEECAVRRCGPPDASDAPRTRTRSRCLARL